MRELAGVTFFVLALCALLVGSIDFFQRRQCAHHQEATGEQTKYFTLNTCYIKTKNGWLDWKTYHTLAVLEKENPRK